jgi:hypothetical protein
MTERKDPDPIELLRQANPVSADRLPSAKLARVRARVQENVMTDNQPSADRGWAERRRRRAIGFAGVAGVAGVAIAVVAFGFGGSLPGITPGASEGGGMGMCIQFDQEMLAQQEYAFDGTVTAVDGESVSFTIATSYRGDGAGAVTLTEVGLGGGVTTSGSLVNFQVGDRYLVSGSGGVITGCGYSQAYDDAAAAEWASIFGG